MLRIVVFDTDQILLQMLVDALRNHEVKCFTSSVAMKTALLSPSEPRADVLLIPGNESAVLVPWLHGQGYGGAIVVLGEASLSEALLGLQVAAVLEKPFSKKALFNAIKSAAFMSTLSMLRNDFISCSGDLMQCLLELLRGYEEKIDSVRDEILRTESLSEFAREKLMFLSSVDNDTARLTEAFTDAKKNMDAVIERDTKIRQLGFS